MNLYKILYLITCLLLSMWSCSDDDESIRKEIIDEPLEITASKDNIILDSSDPDSQALKFTWTKGTNHATGFAIVYTFQIGVQGSNFENGITMEMGRNIYEYAYRTDELNRMLIEKFGVNPSSETTLEYRILAKVTSDGYETQISPTKTIKLTTYKPVTESLYITGTAIQDGINTSMAPVIDSHSVFMWKGELFPGDYSFVTELNSSFPVYCKGTNEGTLYLCESADDPNYSPFSITNRSTYTIYVDLIAMTITLEEETPKYTQLWIQGAGTNWQLVPMTVDPEDKFIFRYIGDLTSTGGIKIYTQNNYSGVVLRPPGTGYKNGVDLDVIEQVDGADNKWDVKFMRSTAHITLNLRTMKIDIAKKSNTISLVGDASPGGWTTNVTNMTLQPDGNIFKWTGQLNPGSFRLSCNGQWGEEMYFPAEHGKIPSGTEEPVYAYKPGGKDTNWAIEEAGMYTIELNQLKETIVIKKQ